LNAAIFLLLPVPSIVPGLYLLLLSLFSSTFLFASGRESSYSIVEFFFSNSFFIAKTHYFGLILHPAQGQGFSHNLGRLHLAIGEKLVIFSIILFLNSSSLVSSRVSVHFSF
jgi:hypothetical protein